MNGQGARAANQAERLALGSIAIGLAVLGLKFAAWRLTGSVALYSDALESTINVVAALVAFGALRLSAKPADANHPYGHQKIEYIAAVFEGALILLAALAVLHAAYQAFLAPRAVVLDPLGIGLNIGAGLINGAWSMVLIRRGRALRSPALIADGRHLLADVISSAGVLAALVLVLVTGLDWLDPALACLVALNILWSGWGLMQSSFSGLMDEAAAPEELGRIRAVISAQAQGAIEAHDLRTRHAGRLTFIEFHLVVPGEMRVDCAHDICDRIEAALRAEIEGASITIHVEPENKAKHQGIVVL
ncbi:cation diffusion facilitator family transporter [Rhabdaerophilum calidifontis]|uniref:cation diffusion facilitator family transporter n=1 Tax=Rhabdaerophilum calidifontis TaxID=2604328 RepID=UPI001239F3EC|nr:cation diffusion facilitator family transporter [Rhabdaerophilum calidifontis]